MARSRLYQSRFLQPNTHFAAFFEIFKIYRLLHRSTFKISRFFSQNFVKSWWNFEIFYKILPKFSKICNFSPKISRIFAGISQNISKFDGIDIAIIKFRESFEKIPKFYRHILQKLNRQFHSFTPSGNGVSYTGPTGGCHCGCPCALPWSSPYLSALRHL